MKPAAQNYPGVPSFDASSRPDGSALIGSAKLTAASTTQSVESALALPQMRNLEMCQALDSQEQQTRAMFRSEAVRGLSSQVSRH